MWVLHGAQEIGLALNPQRRAAIKDEFDIMGPLRNTEKSPSGLTLRANKSEPFGLDGVDTPAQRHRNVPEW